MRATSRAAISAKARCRCRLRIPQRSDWGWHVRRPRRRRVRCRCDRRNNRGRIRRHRLVWPRIAGQKSHNRSRRRERREHFGSCSLGRFGPAGRTGHVIQTMLERSEPRRRSVAVVHQFLHCLRKVSRGAFRIGSSVRCLGGVRRLLPPEMERGDKRRRSLHAGTGAARKDCKRDGNGSGRCPQCLRQKRRCARGRRHRDAR